MSADRHIVKIWDASSGEGYTSIEPGQDINDVCVWPGSGLVLLGCDAPRIQAYFIPSMGPAPRWCSFLESLTEELEESAAPAVYDDYRFVTRADLVGGRAGGWWRVVVGWWLVVVTTPWWLMGLAAGLCGYEMLRLTSRCWALRGTAGPALSPSYTCCPVPLLNTLPSTLLRSSSTRRPPALQDKLGLSHLVGTPLLRAYMHGFFMDNRLYGKAKALADPFAYEAYRAKRIAAKMDEERRSRISLVRKLPRVNAAAAAKILAEEAGIDTGDGGAAAAKRAKRAATAAAEAEVAGKPAPAVQQSLLEDSRFKVMFEDPAFTIDERSDEWKLLHPNTGEPLAREADELTGGATSVGGEGPVCVC